MIYDFITNKFNIINILSPLSFRCSGAVLTALFISFILGPSAIHWLKSNQVNGQPIRDNGPESHPISKKGTPTMGGLLILSALIISTVLWAKLSNVYIWITLFINISFGAIGFLDDWLKINRKNIKGLKVKLKLAAQVAVATGATLAILSTFERTTAFDIVLPFFNNVLLDLGWFFIPFAVFTIIGAANAVNLTDGLDGLAIMPVIIIGSVFALISYIVSNTILASHLHIYHLPNTSELTILCSGLVGACLGFLWFNAPPAMVFMGDTGSLSLGATLGTISIITKQELMLAIIGGLFVFETISVIIQVASFKLTGKRVFRMAPLHHHFEKIGWKESAIVIRFWIIAIILALTGLSIINFSFA
ncbi:phospho-N-acetylmuramoyl-pentapeptide-transferas e [Candidatus Endolissoclinum faulkneri L5]|uniref:Phospho-N-acetylmuramoyl-pentapeptide-transferase n=1 Tax=Candidatus Endolissoclinum faulkneri L5 TaxID=1401328 RepID=V9TSH8_9PROT|nr:phospho-N-acetylmuramoyl-pentapeptide-transferase [Candidatus Endolissoclinum faulkneri]AHC73859.1 phospho-N-acetylmuramoyl-pentapeptide-transferas e [Candidatus Endolissoclinum faulkneri L5]